MTNKVVIDRLIVRSQGEQDAILDFNRGLNVITGPSDSGKSYVLDLLDFMFGASKLRRRIPEIEAYNYVILQLTFIGDDPGHVSIARNINGGAYELREGHVETVGSADEPRRLSATHNPRNLDNLSNYLLDKIGLAGSMVRRNLRNQTRSLSFRDLAHLSLIDETSMQSAVSPVTPTGQYTTRTVEESVFSLLLEGEDDSGLSESPPLQRRSVYQIRGRGSLIALLRYWRISRR
ncbi:AAA family ATPase [Mycolicibacterium novocastrense]|nr:AAA family ATPase [Mycolicibacterium novocastrense]